MRWTLATLFLALAVSVLGDHRVVHKGAYKPRRLRSGSHQRLVSRAENQTQSPFLNGRSSEFAVNGSAIPLVDFDVGESYAGLLPIGNDTSSELYFWFFPSTNPVAQQNKEIVIYLTGGPGCSSMGELLQSNGPISWQPGTFQPIANKFAWNRLTNVVWIDQPVGTGYSQGTPTATNEQDVAQQFLGFWQNFVDTFALQGYKVYLTSSSYGGMYAPFISSAMLDRNDTRYFNVSGMAVWDGLYSKVALTEDIPVARHLSKWQSVLPLNNSFLEFVKTTDAQCGYSAYLDEFLVYPPKGPQPADLPGQDPLTNLPRPECSLYAAVVLAALEVNPCFDAFDITLHCPVPFDPIGFAGGHFTLPTSFPTPYFDLPAVKSALHANPNTTWTFCQNPLTHPVFAPAGIDQSLNSGPGSQPVLPSVIERTGNVILGHGARDTLVLPEATLLTIQNLTWREQMGFQSNPGQSGVLYVPEHDNSNVTTAAGSGVVGSSHVERGLTWFGAAMAGHLVGMDQPAVTFRMLEVLLGRVEGLESTVPFTVDMGGAGGGGGQPAVTAGGLGTGTVGGDGEVVLDG